MPAGRTRSSGKIATALLDAMSGRARPGDGRARVPLRCVCGGESVTGGRRPRVVRVMAERDARMDSLTHHTVDHLVLSFGHQPRPPRDSVATWLLNANYVASPRPALGTIEALVASGDFGAIRSDSLRSAILRYLDTTREYVADLEVYISRAHEQRQRLQSHFRYGGVWDATYDLRDTDVLGWSGDAVFDTTGRAASPDWVYPFPFDVMTLYDDPEVLDTLMRFGDMLLELQKQRTVFRESAAALREQVEAEIRP